MTFTSLHHDISLRLEFIKLVLQIQKDNNFIAKLLSIKILFEILFI